MKASLTLGLFGGMVGSSLCLLALSCSNAGSSSAPPPLEPPPSGASFRDFLPMNETDVYHFQTGMTLRIERATEPNLHSTAEPVMRLAFDDRHRKFGFYWSHGDARGTLVHGDFDESSGIQTVFDVPIPVFGPGRHAEEYTEYRPIGSSVTFDHATILQELKIIRLGHHPQSLYVPTIFGRWHWHEMLNIEWRLTFQGPDGSRDVELAMYCGPGFGPLYVSIDGVVHSTMTAVVGGRVYYEITGQPGK